MPVVTRFIFLGLFLFAGLIGASNVNADPLVTNPVPGSQLNGDTETFQWSANGTGVSEWWLYVGTSVGDNDIYNSGSLSSGVTSATVSGLPTDGSTVWVRLWYVDGTWDSVDFQYNATGGSGDPAVTTPVPGTQLSGDTETFQWSANGAGVSEWWLYVGTSVGDNDIYDSGSLSSGVTSDTVSSLPTDGSTVWVRLWYVDGSWNSVDYQYSATGGGGEPAVTTPVPGTQLSGDTETFQWSANGAGVSEWWLYVGTSVGDNDIYDSGSLSSGVTSDTVSSLPTDGSTVWVRLWYVDGSWNSVDYQYTATGSGGTPAVNSPTAGTQLSGDTETFQWSANGAGVSEWWLYVGTGVGGNEFYDSGSLSSGVTSATVTGLPTDGSTVWVRLQYITDQYYSIDYQYTAAGGTGDPAISAPVPGTQLGNTETFQWSANGAGVSEWWLYVGTSVGDNDIYNSGSLSSGVTSATVSGLPTDGSTVWVRLWYVDGTWDSVDFQYNATGGSGDPAVTTPVPGTQLSGDTETFEWDANGTSVSEWWLYIGTSVGGNEIYNSESLGSGVTSATVSGLPTDGSTVWVRLWYVSDHWHHLDFQYTAILDGIWILSPESNGLMDQFDVNVQAIAAGFPQDWSVDFVLDNQFNNAVPGTLVQGTSNWEASLGDLSKTSYTLTAIMVDETGTQQAGFSHQIAFDVGDYYVAFGDSISDGTGDDITSDNQSLDGRNTSRGYTPILNDLLTSTKGTPHSIVVQAIVGYDSADGLEEIGGAVASHPESSYFLIQFGTNDSSDLVPSGYLTMPGDGGYPGTFKDNMQQMIDVVQGAGKVALLAKVPIRYAECSTPANCQSYVQQGIAPEDGIANVFIRDYNLVIDELIQENGLELDPIGSPGTLLIAPDLYTYFDGTGLDGQGKSPLFHDWTHPDGLGYQDMADLWLQSLAP